MRANTIRKWAVGAIVLVGMVACSDGANFLASRAALGWWTCTAPKQDTIVVHVTEGKFEFRKMQGKTWTGTWELDDKDVSVNVATVSDAVDTTPLDPPWQLALAKFDTLHVGSTELPLTLITGQNSANLKVVGAVKSDHEVRIRLTDSTGFVSPEFSCTKSSSAIPVPTTIAPPSTTAEPPLTQGIVVQCIGDSINGYTQDYLLDPASGRTKNLASKTCSAGSLSADMRFAISSEGYKIYETTRDASPITVVGTLSGDTIDVTKALHGEPTDSFSEVKQFDSNPYFLGNLLYFETSGTKTNSSTHEVSFDPVTKEFDETPEILLPADVNMCTTDNGWCRLSPNGTKIASINYVHTVADRTSYQLIDAARVGQQSSLACGNASNIEWLDDNRLVCGDGLLNVLDISKARTRADSFGAVTGDLLVDLQPTLPTNPNANSQVVVGPDHSTLYFRSHTDDGAFYVYKTTVGSKAEPTRVASLDTGSGHLVGWLANG